MKTLCCFIFSIFTVVAGDGLGTGIVTKYFPSGSRDEGPFMGWTGEPEMLEYKHYVECDYNHEYLYQGNKRKFRFELHCLSFGEVNGAPDYTVFIDYDYNVLDRFNVTSCKPEDIVNNIFPPLQTDHFSEKDSMGLPNTHHLRFISTDKTCHDRKYSFVNRISRMARRHDPETIPCPSDLQEWLSPTSGVVAKFGNCRVPIVPVPHIVIDWHTKETPLDWFPGVKDDNGKKFKRLLECDWDRLYYQWKLLCVKIDGAKEYSVFLSKGGQAMERLTVTSCKEEDLVNSIFPPRYTTYHPGSEYGPQHLKFAATDGKCYDRQFDDGEDSEFDDILASVPKEISCPKYDDEWVNPTMGSVGMFGHCKVLENEEEKKAEKVESRDIKDIKLADKPGIVTKYFPSGSRDKGPFMGWTGEPEMLEYKHYVECDYNHEYLYQGNKRKFRFELHCLSFGEVNGAPDYTVFIDYDNNVLDRFNVTSCKPEDIVNNIFPPLQTDHFNEKDLKGLPNTHHLRFINTDKTCHDRKYSFVNRISRMAERHDPETIPCPSNLEEWLNPTTGVVAKFGNCRVPIVPVPHTVIDWHTKETPLDWFPGVKDDDGKKFKRLLECDWDRLYYQWKLLCVKIDGAKDYSVFLSKGGQAMERLTVTSCKEDDLVNSIFPPRYTTYHPGSEYGPQHLKFASTDGKCYDRWYRITGVVSEPKEVPCPKYDDEWVNPTMGLAGMFGHCKILGAVEAENKETVTQKLDNQESAHQKPNDADTEQKKPDHAETEQKKLDHAEAEQKKPDHAEAEQKKPDHTEAEQKKLDNAKTEQKKPDHAETEQKKQDHAETEQKKLDNAKTEQKNPDHAEAEQKKQDHAETEQKKLDNAKTEQKKPDHAEAEQKKQDHAETEQKKLDNAKTEQKKLDNAKTEQKKPDHAETEQKEPVHPSIVISV